MEFRVAVLLLALASSVLGELNGDQQSGFNFQPNEGQSQQGFGQNMYGNKISQVETKPSVNQAEHQKTRLPIPASSVPLATPFYAHFQPMQGSFQPEVVSETQPQKPSTIPEAHNHLAPPVPYPYPYPNFLSNPATFAPPAPYGSNTVQGPKVLQPQNQNGNFLPKPAEHPNSITPPVAYPYPVPIAMPFPSYFPYPQTQYPQTQYPQTQYPR